MRNRGWLLWVVVALLLVLAVAYSHRLEAWMMRLHGIHS